MEASYHFQYITQAPRIRSFAQFIYFAREKTLEYTPMAEPRFHRKGAFDPDAPPPLAPDDVDGRSPQLSDDGFDDAPPPPLSDDFDDVPPPPLEDDVAYKREAGRASLVAKQAGKGVQKGAKKKKKKKKRVEPTAAAEELPAKAKKKKKKKTAGPTLPWKRKKAKSGTEKPTVHSTPPSETDARADGKQKPKKKITASASAKKAKKAAAAEAAAAKIEAAGALAKVDAKAKAQAKALGKAKAKAEAEAKVAKLEEAESVDSESEPDTEEEDDDDDANDDVSESNAESGTEAVPARLTVRAAVLLPSQKATPTSLPATPREETSSASSQTEQELRAEEMRRSSTLERNDVATLNDANLSQMLRDMARAVSVVEEGGVAATSPLRSAAVSSPRRMRGGPFVLDACSPAIEVAIAGPRPEESIVGFMRQWYAKGPRAYYYELQRGARSQQDALDLLQLQIQNSLCESKILEGGENIKRSVVLDGLRLHGEGGDVLR